MNTLIKSMEAEFRRYKTMAEGALSQVAEPQLSAPGPGNGNSLVIICRHIAGNLRSRFTEFLTSDGEKPWRHREEEFAAREVSREELLADWEARWSPLPASLAGHADAPLGQVVTIRGQPVAAHEALLRNGKAGEGGE